MRTRLFLTALVLAFTANASAAQTAIQLRWELVGDTGAFTLTNRDTKALAPSGWAIYYSALHGAGPGTVGSGFAIEDVIGDLHRLVPAAGFAGLSPGASIRIPYRTDLLLNRSFAPQGPYIVFDAAKEVGVPLIDYVAAPFERRVLTPESQFTLDSLTRAVPASELSPVFPTPVEVTPGAGALRLTAMPPVEAAEALKNEATFAAEYLRAYFGSDDVNVSVAFPAPFGVTRTYRKFSEITEEVDNARVWGGIHFRSADQDGSAVGRKIGDMVMRDFGKPPGK